MADSNEMATLLNDTINDNNKTMIINYLKFMKSQDEKPLAYSHINIKQIGILDVNTTIFSFDKNDQKYTNAFKAFKPKENKEYCVYANYYWSYKSRIGEVYTNETLHFLEYTSFKPYVKCENEYVIALDGTTIEERVNNENGKIKYLFQKTLNGKTINMYDVLSDTNILSYSYSGDILTQIVNDEYSVTKKDNTYVITEYTLGIDDRVLKYIRELHDNKHDFSMFHMAK